MTAREEMLVKMGRAAMREHSIVCAHHMSDAEAERIGLAALAAMVPPAVDFPHMGEFGNCDTDCPFHRNDEEAGYGCTVGISVVRRNPEGWDYMQPSPSCPAYKGEPK